ncbi:MAG TPA: dockerin type I domain-containing protein, partial [Thermoflexales bacterium]|nr:dockerin type I domain-containing protein [Thermoflexales bacterium]
MYSKILHGIRVACAFALIWSSVGGASIRPAVAQPSNPAVICADVACETPALDKADFDGNGVIDQADLLAVKNKYDRAGTGADAVFDVNGDGLINVYDVQFVAERVGLILRTATPTATATNTPTST